MSGVQFSAWARIRFLSPRHRVQTGSGPTQLPIQLVPEALTPGVKQVGREADDSRPRTLLRGVSSDFCRGVERLNRLQCLVVARSDDRFKVQQTDIQATQFVAFTLIAARIRPYIFVIVVNRCLTRPYILSESLIDVSHVRIFLWESLIDVSLLSESLTDVSHVLIFLAESLINVSHVLIFLSESLIDVSHVLIFLSKSLIDSHTSSYFCQSR
jgi:hypothetical protein